MLRVNACFLLTHRKRGLSLRGLYCNYRILEWRTGAEIGINRNTNTVLAEYFNYVRTHIRLGLFLDIRLKITGAKVNLKEIPRCLRFN